MCTVCLFCDPIISILAIYVTGSGVWLETFDNPKEVPYIPYSTSKEYEGAYQGFVRFWTYIILFQVNTAVMMSS